ncbi:hypothetical protein TWF569_001937 [Orbilia oligospora]|nr:hypothetical protein TWF569_001937 [Orbilia oligospora]
MIERGTMHCAIIEGGHLQYHASARLDTWGPQEPHEGPERWQKSLAGSCSSHPSHHICTSHHEFMHLTHHPVPRDPPFPNNQPPRSLVHCGVSVSKCYSKVSFGCKASGNRQTVKLDKRNIIASFPSLPLFVLWKRL